MVTCFCLHFVRLWRCKALDDEAYTVATFTIMRALNLYGSSFKYCGDEINFAANFRFIWCLVTLTIWVRCECDFGYMATRFSVYERLLHFNSILFLCATTKGMRHHILQVIRWISANQEQMVANYASAKCVDTQCGFANANDARSDRPLNFNHHILINAFPIHLCFIVQTRKRKKNDVTQTTYFYLDWIHRMQNKLCAKKK